MAAIHPQGAGPATGTPATPGSPATPGAGRRTRVTGGARVPVTVWPCAPLPASCPDRDHTDPERTPCAGRVCGPVAGLIVEAFSAPGDLVVVPKAGTGAVLIAAATRDRQVVGLARDPAHATRVVERLERDLTPTRRAAARVEVGPVGRLLDAGNRLTGRATLAVLTPCCHPETEDRHAGGAARAEQAQLSSAEVWAACYRVLRPGGVLAVLTRDTVHPHRHGARLLPRTGQAVAQARAAGLIYLQHIVALHAAIRGGCLVAEPLAAHRALLRWARATGLRLHLPVHSDLLVFTKPGGGPTHA